MFVKNRFRVSWTTGKRFGKINGMNKLTPEQLEEARKLWLEGMGYRPMERYFKEKYPKSKISHQSLMYHLSPKHRERTLETWTRRKKVLSEARRKEYADSLKKLYGKKKK